MPVAAEMPVIAILFSRSTADCAIDALHVGGICAEDIGVVMRDRQLARGPETADAVDETGIGRLAGIGVVNSMVPAVGPILCAGTLGVVLSNASDGDVIAGITGALLCSGVPAEHAGFYAREFSSGRVIITVNAGNRANEVRTILRRFGATSKDPAFRTSTV